MGAIGIECSDIGSFIPLQEVHYSVFLRCTFAVANGGIGSTTLNGAGIINNAQTSLQTVVSNFQIAPTAGDGLNEPLQSAQKTKDL